jgi:Uma2 family endonuclease
MATQAKRLLTVEEFLELEIDVEGRVELDNGVIRMMAGGSAAHARVQGNVFGTLFDKLRGKACRPYGSDMGLRAHDLSLRYPDVSVFCGREGPENDKLQMFNDPHLVVEVLSPSTRDSDVRVKLPEYCAIHSLRAILYIDPEAETVRLLSRNVTGGWLDTEIAQNGDVNLPDLDIKLRHEEIFQR